jgi:broad specificity phosphatase PhoE
MKRRLLFLLALVAGFSVHALAQGAPTVVIVVRHAEKGTMPANDPPLTEPGMARARALAAALADADVQAVISTPLTRTRETARPTAEAHGVTIEYVATGPAAEHAKAVAEMVRKHGGKTVLVVGHSNTVAPIIAALGGPKMPDLCDSQYASLFMLVINGSTTKLVRGTFGEPSPDLTGACANKMY